jgi:hypothetical protein
MLSTLGAMFVALERSFWRQFTGLGRLITHWVRKLSRRLSIQPALAKVLKVNVRFSLFSAPMSCGHECQQRVDFERSVLSAFGQKRALDLTNRPPQSSHWWHPVL